MNIICLDTETTGLNRYDDEILQLSIIDGSGAILFSEYVKPVHHESWTDAEKVNHISPSMVKDCKPLLYYAHTIQLILENADMIVGYNIHGFDLPFIFNSGIEYHAKENSIVVDVMLAFAEIYGQKRYNEYKWQKLKTCAEYYSAGMMRLTMQKQRYSAFIKSSAMFLKFLCIQLAFIVRLIILLSMKNKSLLKLFQFLKVEMF